MKINLMKLRGLYTSGITDFTQMSRENCLSPEILTECLRGQASKKNKNRMIEHISHCSYCMKEFQLILEIHRDEKKFIQKIAPLFDIHSQKNPDVLKKKAPFPFQQMRWNHAVFAAGAVLIVAGSLILYFLIQGGLGQKFRGTNIDHIILIKPVHNKSTRTPIVFQWKKMMHAEYYILELFDDTLFPIWKSWEIKKNKLQLPRETVESFSSGKSYYWFITGFFPGDRKIESSLEQFIFLGKVKSQNHRLEQKLPNSEDERTLISSSSTSPTEGLVPCYILEINIHRKNS